MLSVIAEIELTTSALSALTNLPTTGSYLCVQPVPKNQKLFFSADLLSDTNSVVLICTGLTLYF